MTMRAIVSAALPALNGEITLMFPLGQRSSAAKADRSAMDRKAAAMNVVACLR
jgi:hypothetical protein